MFFHLVSHVCVVSSLPKYRKSIKILTNRNGSSSIIPSTGYFMYHMTAAIWRSSVISHEMKAPTNLNVSSSRAAKRWVFLRFFSWETALDPMIFPQKKKQKKIRSVSPDPTEHERRSKVSENVHTHSFLRCGLLSSLLKKSSSSAYSFLLFDGKQK